MTPAADQSRANGKTHCTRCRAVWFSNAGRCSLCRVERGPVNVWPVTRRSAHVVGVMLLHLAASALCIGGYYAAWLLGVARGR